MERFTLLVKRGESLVEVVVALGILAFVFAGALSLISSTVTLNLASRQRTEAIALAQKNMNDYIVNGFFNINNDSGSCVINPPLDNEDFEDGKDICDNKTDFELTTELCHYFVARTLAGTNESDASTLLDDNNFIIIDSYVVWYNRGTGKQEYFISKLVRKR